MGNVRKLKNVMDKLKAPLRKRVGHRKQSIVFSSDSRPRELLRINVFQIVWADGTESEIGNERAAFINKKWCFPGYVITKGYISHIHTLMCLQWSYIITILHMI